MRKNKLRKNKHLPDMEELKKKHDWLKQNIAYAQEISKTGSWTYDIQKEEILFTDEVYRILECSPEELDGKLENYYLFVHPEDLNDVKQVVQEGIYGKEYEIEYRIITKGGIEKYVYEANRVLYGENNNVIKMIGIVQDITKQKLRENNLKEIRDNFNQAQRVAGVGSWKYDIIKNEFYGSDEMFNIYGLDPLEFRYHNDFSSVIKLVHPEDQFKIQDALEKHLSGQACTIEFRIPQQDGTNKFVIGKAEPIFDAQDNVVAIIGTLQDITERKLLEEKLKKSYKIINQAQALTGIGSWEMDIINDRIYWSDEARRIYGFSPERTFNTLEEFRKHIHPEDIKHIDDLFKIIPKKPVELEFRFVQDDGSVRNIYELAEFVFDKDGNPIYMYGTIQDIAEKKELQKKLESNQEKINTIQKRFDALIKESADVFEILDSDGRILYISEAVERITGYKTEEHLGKNVYTFYEKSEIKKLREMMAFVLKNPEKKITSDILFKTKFGKEIYLEFCMRNFLHDPAIEGIVANFRDVTDRVKNEKRIIHLSTHDQLTGLPNKVSFDNKFKLLFENVEENNAGFAILMLDIDSLVYIKNTLGYKVAEQYIIQIAIRLKLYCRNKYYICRYCDDRFVIIVEGLKTISEYEDIVKEIYDLFSQVVKVNKYELDVDISIGISIYDEDEQKNQKLIRHAETALVLAKNEGKNRYKFYSSGINVQSYKHFILRNDLKRAIEDNQLILYYQPIVNLKTNEILAAEALIRWEHPEWGTISPAEFISIAEETGHMIQIGYWLLREVCRNYKQWLSNGLPNIKVAINFSSMQFFEADFVEKIKNIVDEYKLNPNFLIMEITESTLMEKTDKANKDIKELQALGIQIALDDFGTGYSSLSYLSSFDIDILKIDGSFVKSINTNEVCTTITRYIIKIAQELQIKLVAEHIENWEQLDFLRELKCYAGQGYLFSKPVPPEDFEKILAKIRCTPTVEKTKAFHGERRKFFRIKFIQLLEGDLTILEIKGKKINIGNTKVLIKNIGPGGLCFVSNIRFPVQRDIVLQFITQLVGEEVRVYGCPVWTREIDDDLFEYGVEFTFDENKRTDLIRVLNQVQVKMKNDILFAEGSFVSGSPSTYFKR